MRGRTVQLVAAEPLACPKMTRGAYLYDINDFSGTTPVTRMYTLGSSYLAPPIHAGGLALSRHVGLLERALCQRSVQGARAQAGRGAEGAVPCSPRPRASSRRPKSAYAIAAALQTRRESKANAAPCILMNISGHGLFDLSAYEQARRGELTDDTPDERMIEASLAGTIERNAELAEANPSNVSA